MNVFDLDLGYHQGRIRNDVVPGGAFVYELGHARMIDGDLIPGDYHEVWQRFVATPGMKFIRPWVRVVTPRELPADGWWEISASLNGAKVIARRLRPSRRTLLLDDWRISLAAARLAPDTNVLAFRLGLYDGTADNIEYASSE